MLDREILRDLTAKLPNLTSLLRQTTIAGILALLLVVYIHTELKRNFDKLLTELDKSIITITFTLDENRIDSKVEKLEKDVFFLDRLSAEIKTHILYIKEKLNAIEYDKTLKKNG